MGRCRTPGSVGIHHRSRPNRAVGRYAGPVAEVLITEYETFVPPCGPAAAVAGKEARWVMNRRCGQLKAVEQPVWKQFDKLDIE
jgi:hypothetical protein